MNRVFLFFRESEKDDFIKRGVKLPMLKERNTRYNNQIEAAEQNSVAVRSQTSRNCTLIIE
jgi:hypothetical protein